MPNLRREARAWIEALVRSMPGGLGSKLRRKLYARWFGIPGAALSVAEGVHVNGRENISFGVGIAIGSGCRFEATAGKITVGAKSAFNHGVWLGADHGTIEIGQSVIVGPYTVMRAADHKFDRIGEIPISKQGHKAGSIVIHDDVWIGAHVTILAGSRIGSHSVVAAGAVVRGEVAPYSVIGGVPARLIKSLARETARDFVEETK